MEQPARPTASRQSGPAAAQEAVTSVGGGPQQPEQPEEAEAAGHAEPAEKGDSCSLVDNPHSRLLTPTS